MDGKHFLPTETRSIQKVGTPSPQLQIPPEKLIHQLAYSHLELIVDLVFYHRILKCHVLIELKIDEFSHEHLGQLNTYVSWYQQNEMTPGDNPPVGILLCTQKNHPLVEYALAGIDNQLFVSKYQLELRKREEMQRFLAQQMKVAAGYGVE